jgi:mannose-1-phosphate guanylyltransferase
MSQVCAVIMAGGVGTRFWPRSRERSPKQLLEILGKGTMIQNTVKRIAPLVPPQNVFVVTNRVQRAAVVKQLPQVPEENILDEPVGRNTAPCIGLAAMHVRRRVPDAVMVVLPADHMIAQEEDFLRVLSLAIGVARESKSLLTLGIHPTRPETGYGYIQFDNEGGAQNPYLERGVMRVRTFAEKPNIQTAERFLASGDFLWNSGMFVWRADVILDQIRACLPELFEELQKAEQGIGTSQYQSLLEKAYGVIRGISIDYGVMEKSEQVFVIRGDFGWTDVGSWDEVWYQSGKDAHGNSITGKVIQRDLNNSLVYSPDRIVAVIGADDLIIVDTPDALLICRRGRSQDVKEIADYLRRKQMDQYL